MALNSYARLTLNGAALSGDVTTQQIGGVAVGSGHIEVMRVSFGAETAREAVALVYAAITLTHEDGGLSFEDQLGRIV